MFKSIALFLLIFTAPMAAMANMDCFETPANDAVFQAETGFNKQAEREKMYGQLENPAQELMVCAVSAATSLALAQDNCACKTRVKELCSFRKKDGKFRYSAGGGAELAWCFAFPLTMWTRR